MNTIKKAITAVSLAVSLTLCACSSGSDAPKATQTPSPLTHTFDNLNITLNSDFIESNQEQYTFFFSSSDSICIGQKENKSELNSAGITVNSLSEYASLIMGNTGITSEPVTYGQGLYYEWEKNVNGTDYSYIAYVIDTGDSYWVIQFASLKELYNGLKDYYLSCFDSITF